MQASFLVLVGAVALLGAGGAGAQGLPSNGVQGSQLSSLLREQGVTLISPPDEPVVLFDENDVADARALRLSPGGFALLQHGAGKPCDFVLEFKRPVGSISFSRSYLKASRGGARHPYWTATAYDEEDHPLGSVGELRIKSHADVPAKRFTLPGPWIKRVVFWGDGRVSSGFCNVVVDTVDAIGPFDAAAAVAAEPDRWSLNPESRPGFE
jgi:hypothetical protein